MQRAFVVGVAAVVVTLSGSVAAGGQVGAGRSSAARVLRVGTYHGVAGQYASIQQAVDAAAPGDWILVGPGDHKTPDSTAPAGAADYPAGVLVTTPRLHLRGMNRDSVIVDGTRSGPPCSTAAADQVPGPAVSGKALGRNGILVYEADDVTIENLTTCNFLNGPGQDNGNDIWWDGGGNAKITGWGFTGSYLTTTNTYYHDETSASQYGIYSNDWSGGEWDHSYASNFNDSGFYIGACQQMCDQTVDGVWAEYDALGYSGSNSGGQLVVENSQFDHNEDGFDTNSQNGDNPPPQDGACPDGGISPITHTHSCWVFMHNYSHDNNDPNVPTAGSAAAGPVGTGMSISGGRNDTVMDNVFSNNDAWGTIFVPYPDSGPPCTGGTLTPAACLYDESGDALVDNTYAHNGSYGNPTNGDVAAVNLEPGPTDCYHGNTEAGGGAATFSPPWLEVLYPSCTGATTLPDANAVFLDEVACDSGAISIGPVQGNSTCPPGADYPRQTQVVMHPLPGASADGSLSALEDPMSTSLPTMPDPCQGVPANPWCPVRTTAGPTGPRGAPPGSRASLAGGHGVTDVVEGDQLRRLR